jgi:hypothetical protein
MALIYADRVQETTVTLGTGTLTLAGPVAGFQSFSVVGVGNTTYYVIFDTTTNEWEVGLGTVGPSTLARTTVLASTNANTLVNFAAGSKSVFTSLPASVITSLLTTAVHNTVNHTGLPGVPAAEAFTSTVHGATNHIGIAGVGDLTTAAHATTNHSGITGVGNLATAPGTGVVDHTTLSHTGLPGVGDLTTAAHAALNHSSIPGVGLTTRQSLIFPVSMLHQYWAPSPSAVNLSESFLPSSTGGDTEFGDMTIDDSAGSTPAHIFTTVAGFGPARQYTFPSGGDVLRMESPPIISTALARLVFKLRLPSINVSSETTFGIGTTSAGTFFGQNNAIFARQSGTGAWTIERRVGAVTKTSTPTGIAGTTAIYVLFNYTSTTSVTVAFYDATTFAVLFTTTFSGASEVPTVGSLALVRVYVDGASSNIVQLGSILLSYNE